MLKKIGDISLLNMEDDLLKGDASFLLQEIILYLIPGKILHREDYGTMCALWQRTGCAYNVAAHPRPLHVPDDAAVGCSRVLCWLRGRVSASRSNREASLRACDSVHHLFQGVENGRTLLLVGQYTDRRDNITKRAGRSRDYLAVAFHHDECHEPLKLKEMKVKRMCGSTVPGQGSEADPDDKKSPRVDSAPGDASPKINRKIEIPGTLSEAPKGPVKASPEVHGRRTRRGKGPFRVLRKGFPRAVSRRGPNGLLTDMLEDFLDLMEVRDKGDDTHLPAAGLPVFIRTSSVSCSSRFSRLCFPR
jgi:hypothetical protein